MLNLATGRAALDGATVLNEYTGALLASGIATVGFGANLNEALAPAIVGSSESAIAIYGISLADDLTPSLIATNTSPGIAGGLDAIDLLVDEVEASIEAGRTVVIVADFDQADDRSPSTSALDNVQTLADAGADVIVGHGSDFLQRFERLDQTTVVFNLGNAVVETDEALRRDTAILRFSVAEDTTTTCLVPATGGPDGLSIDDPSSQDCQ